MSDCAEFRELVCWIARRLREQDITELRYMYDLPEWHQQRGSTASSLETLRELQRRGEFSASSPEGLIRVLEKIERKDLIKEVQGQFEVWQRRETVPQMTMLVSDLSRSCRVTKNEAKSLATQTDKIGKLLKERSMNDRDEPSQQLELLKGMLEKHQSRLAENVRKCSAMENATTICVEEAGIIYAIAAIWHNIAYINYAANGGGPPPERQVTQTWQKGSFNNSILR